jgi:hypothetical protein
MVPRTWLVVAQPPPSSSGRATLTARLAPPALNHVRFSRRHDSNWLTFNKDGRVGLFCPAVLLEPVQQRCLAPCVTAISRPNTDPMCAGGVVHPDDRPASPANRRRSRRAPAPRRPTHQRHQRHAAGIDHLSTVDIPTSPHLRSLQTRRRPAVGISAVGYGESHLSASSASARQLDRTSGRNGDPPFI